MSLAFSTLLIILLSLPGIVARYWYRKGFWSVPVDISTIPEELVSGIIWTIPVQFAWGWIVKLLLGISINIEVILLLLSGQSTLEEAAVVSSLNGIGQAPELVFIYL